MRADAEGADGVLVGGCGVGFYAEQYLPLKPEMAHPPREVARDRDNYPPGRVLTSTRPFLS